MTSTIAEAAVTQTSPAGSPAAISVTGLTRRYGGQAALDDISIDIEPGSITGLLGRNGAGKTTLMRIIGGHEFASSGHVTVAGASPVENDAVLRRMVFLREDQAYPDLPAKRMMDAAAHLYPNWDAGLAAELAADFGLRLGQRIRKLSRGQRSAVGIVIALGRPGRRDLDGRTLRRPGRGSPAGVLRPAARRLRRIPAHGGAVHAPD
jgi:ABC-type multidrug transport system ATPase subunit